MTDYKSWGNRPGETAPREANHSKSTARLMAAAHDSAETACKWCGLAVEYSETYGGYRVANAGGPATFCHPSPVGAHSLREAR